jgi:hypothetical protein
MTVLARNQTQVIQPVASHFINLNRKKFVIFGLANFQEVVYSVVMSQTFRVKDEGLYEGTF